MIRYDTYCILNIRMHFFCFFFLTKYFNPLSLKSKTEQHNMRIPIMIYIYATYTYIHTYYIYSKFRCAACCCSVIYLCPFHRNGKNRRGENQKAKQREAKTRKMFTQNQLMNIIINNVINFMLIRLPTNNSMHIYIYKCVYMCVLYVY